MAGRKSPDEKRFETREQLWPGSGYWIWEPGSRENVGFARIPRLMPLIMSLIRQLTPRKQGDPSLVYHELWCRDFGQGLITVTDVEEHAFAAGYKSKRAVRTWRTHMQTLVDLGFIRTKQVGNREFGHVLLLHPLAVCAKLRDEKKVTDEWWLMFTKRANDIGATIPPAAIFEKSAFELMMSQGEHGDGL